MAERQPGLGLLRFKCPESKLAVAGGVEVQDGLTHLAVRFEGGIRAAVQSGYVDVTRLPLQYLAVRVGHRNGEAVGTHSVLLDTPSQRDHPLVQGLEVAFDHPELGHGLARNRVDLTVVPIPHLRLRELIGCVVLQRQHHDVLHGIGEVGGRQPGDPLGQ